MNIQLMRIFCDVAKNGSINRTAQLNYISPSSVSRMVKTLETETGRKLFERSYDGVTLTRQGKELFSVVEPILQDLQQVERLYGQWNGETDVERLCVCIHQNSLANQAVIDYYNRYAKSSQHVDIIAASFTSLYEVVHNMQNRIYEIGTIQYNGNYCDDIYRYLEENNMEIIHENARRIYASVRAGHPLLEKSKASVNDLLNYPRVACIQERVVGINYCADIEIFDSSKSEQRILISERAQIDDVLRSTDAYFLGTGCRNVPILSGIGIECVPIDTSMKIMTAIICRKNQVLSDNAKRYVKIMKELFSGTD